MATTMTEPQTATSLTKRYHEFHAHAHALHGELMRPIQQTIERHSFVELKDERGGHLTRFSEDVNIEGLISLKTVHTRVSGSATIKRKGWLTTATSIVEGLNIFEVLTADRVVSQVSTDHPYDKTLQPHVSFLGTKFENLRVCGIPVGVTYNFGVCGTVPNDDQSYLANSTFVSTAQTNNSAIANATYLPADVKKQYDDWSKKETATVISAKVKENASCKVTCSLISKIHIDELRKQVPDVETVGNVLYIPHFGAISLGEIEVGMEREPVSGEFRRHEEEVGGFDKLSNYFQITMLNMHLGCIGHGNVQVASGKSNGNTAP
jgi:hypothetical protein